MDYVFASVCYGGGYPISTAACGEGTIDIYLGAAGSAYYANINDHSLSKFPAYTSRCQHRESSLAVPPASCSRAIDAGLASPISIGRLAPFWLNDTVRTHYASFPLVPLLMLIQIISPPCSATSLLWT